jgi:hypothetical protein
MQFGELVVHALDGAVSCSGYVRACEMARSRDSGVFLGGIVSGVSAWSSDRVVCVCIAYLR